MPTLDELLNKYSHSPDEFPVLKNQTHKIIIDNKSQSTPININENIVHYIQDTALLISIIDGSLNDTTPFEHVIYLDKSARPVSWLVNMLWDEFATKDSSGNVMPRPKHSYINIDRSPWFRNVGINVSDDGRQKENGELAQYTDFIKAAEAGNLKNEHLAQIHALYIDGGIDNEDIDSIMNTPTCLDGKKVLIIDEVSRTGSTLSIAKYLFEHAIPNIGEVTGDYFWHPQEAPLMLGNESVLTSLPVWYDPGTLTGRGIGGLEPNYYRNRYQKYLSMAQHNKFIDIKKLHTQSFASSVFSAPLLNPDGSVLSLKDEKVTHNLTTDLVKMVNAYKAGTIFFDPPYQWRISNTKDELSMEMLDKQGIRIIKDSEYDTLTNAQIDSINNSPTAYRSFTSKLKNS